MTMSLSEGPRKREHLALAVIEIYFDEQGIAYSAARNLRLSYRDNTVSALDIVESLSRILEGHPPFFLLDVAETFFPQYTFECTLGPVPIRAVTANGFKSLYQVAKEATLVNRRYLRSSKRAIIRLFENLLLDCSDQPHILSVFHEVTKDYKRDLFGSLGYISRLMVLTRDFPNILKTLQNGAIRCKGRFELLGTPDEPRPAFVTLEEVTFEYLSKEGCQELLALIEYHRRLVLLTVNNTPLESSNDGVRRLRHSAAYSRRFEYTGTISGRRASSGTPRPRNQVSISSRGQNTSDRRASSGTHRPRNQVSVGSRGQNSRTCFSTGRQHSFRQGTSFTSSGSQPQLRPCGARRCP